MRHLIYEAVNSAVNLFCWNRNHSFCCFVLNKLSSFLLYPYPGKVGCCWAGYSACLSHPVQQLFSQISGAKSLSPIRKSLYYKLLGIHTYMVLECLSIKLTINTLDENISCVDFQYQFVWEHFRV